MDRETILMAKWKGAEEHLRKERENGYLLEAKIARLKEYAEHGNCILSFWEAGEPTSDGGYRTKYLGKWHQSRPVNEEPKCECGLDELLG